MGKLNGGVFLLDLTHIVLQESDDSETWSSISDEYTLEQLDKLKQYIVSPTAKKTIWCKLVDETSDVVCQGALLQNGASFLIDIHYYTYHLQIAVAFDFDAETGEPFVDSASWKMLSLEKQVGEKFIKQPNTEKYLYIIKDLNILQGNQDDAYLTNEVIVLDELYDDTQDFIDAIEDTYFTFYDTHSSEFIVKRIQDFDVEEISSLSVSIFDMKTLEYHRLDI